MISPSFRVLREVERIVKRLRSASALDDRGKIEHRIVHHGLQYARPDELADLIARSRILTHVHHGIEM